MIKRITALVLCLAMTFSVTAFSAEFTDVVMDGSEVSEAVGVLSELGVLSGMGDGTFSPYTSLTRAQFAKIAVCIMGKTDEAVATTDAFSDVKSSDWYSGFVKVVAENGVITGYPDGSFGANDEITAAQAVTILIRLLGYDAADVGYKWPGGYIEKAKVLKITEGMEIGVNSAVTRAQAALLIYRALLTDMKNTNSALITKMDKNVHEDTVIVATNGQNSALLANQVQSDKGIFTYDKAINDMEKYVGYEGTLVVNDKSEAVVFIPDDEITMKEYTVASVYTEDNGNVAVITDENTTVTLNDKSVVYMDGNTYTASKLGEGINPGSKVSLFYENGSLKYVLASEYKYQGPKTVFNSDSATSLFDIKNDNTLKVIRKGLSAEVEDIEVYDVLYYSERTNTIYAYADRVTGSYDDAFPMKSNVSRVEVSGKEYTLSTITAINKLNESDYAFNIGDRVTLLLGKDGTVVDVVNLTDSDMSVYGIVIETGSEISTDKETEGRTQFFVKIMNASGEEVKYQVKDDNYSDKAGKFCEIDFQNSYAVLSFPKSSVKTGVVDAYTKSLDRVKFASDFAVIEYIDSGENRAVVEKISLSDIDGAQITAKRIKHMALNQKGEISFMYIDKVSGNHYTYGVVVSVPEGKDNKKSSSGTFTILNGINSVRVNGTFPSINLGDAVKYYSGIDKAEFTPMAKIASGNKIERITDNVITIDEESYILSDDVVVYAGIPSDGLKAISIDDALSVTGMITLWSDKTTIENGKVRLIRIITP